MQIDTDVRLGWPWAELIGDDASSAWVNANIAGGWGKGTLFAFVPWADPAGDTDRGGGASEKQAVGVDEIRCVLRLAAERDGVSAWRTGEAAGRFYQASSHRDVAHAVRRLSQLHEHSIRYGNGFVHDPQWTRASEPGELQSRSGMPLRNVTRHVDAAEEERHPGRTGPLQGRKPVARLFKAGSEQLTQLVYVMTRRQSRRPEATIRHEESTRSVVRQTRGHELPRRFRPHLGSIGFLTDLWNF